MINRFYLWGAGNIGQRALRYLAPLGIINGIIDSDCAKHGQTFDGLVVSSYDSIYPYLDDSGVVIAHFSPKETEDILNRDGIPNWRLSEFVTNWYWKKRHQNAIGFLDFPITMHCTLNCESCMQYVPFRAKQDIPLEQLKQDISSFFRVVDFVGEISLIGGEPFLHESLLKLISYITDNFRQQFGNLVITTNGTIMPDASLLQLCKQTGVYISISDYSAALPRLEKSIKKLEVAARNAGLHIERKRWTWSDPGRFDVGLGFTDCALPHMQLINGKLWRCTLMAAGCLAGFCEAEDGHDYYDISREGDNIQDFLIYEKPERTSQCDKCLYPKGITIPSALQTDR